jgi:hypothetical protein
MPASNRRSDDADSFLTPRATQLSFFLMPFPRLDAAG